MTLLRAATGVPLVVAGSGPQGGLDAASPRRHPIQVAVECKRYGERTPLSERELRIEIDIACGRNPELDVWVLITTREVTTQEDEALSKACDERGIAYLSLGSIPAPNVGLLDALCAMHEDLAADHLNATSKDALVADFREAAAEVRARRQYQTAVDSLKRRIRSADLGLANFAAMLNARLLEDIEDGVTCMRRFRCALTPASLHAPIAPLRRTAILDQLQAAWVRSQRQDKPSLLLVLGDEGTGKSWVLADWIRELIRSNTAPAIFYLPAREPGSNEAVQVLVKHAKQYALACSESSVEKKLQRWLSTVPTGKRAIVVLDGINERLDADLWADLIEEFGSSRMSSTQLIVTCRSRTWKERLSTRINCRFTTIEVGDFSDSEFGQLIADLSPEHRQAIRSAGRLVRRPRFFHLAIQRVAELHPGEELTAEALYYFDWQHRERLKRGMAVDGTDFADAIRRLAVDRRAGTSVDRQRLESILGAARFSERQEELASSAVLESRVDGWQLRPEYFALGLGMYLAERLEKRGGSIQDRCDEADEILGDTSSLDLTTSVLQHALLHSLLSPQHYCSDTRVALLSVWAGALNSTNALGVALPQLQTDPDMLLAFAEYHWRLDTTSHLMEQAVLAALIRTMRVSHHAPVCLDRLERWASLVHEHGESEPARDGTPRRTHTEVLRLCTTAERFFPASKVVLRRESMQPALRLGRLAVAAVSASSVQRYWKVVETAFVADQAMGGLRAELLTWLIRWCHEPIDDLVDQTTAALIVDADPTCYRAAQRMLAALGSQRLLARLAEIPQEHFPVSPWAEVETGDDPCLSLFRAAPTVDELAGCLARPDVPSHLKARRASAFAADIDFPFPDSYARQIAAEVDSIDVTRLRRHMGTAEADLDLTDRKALCCRLAPEAFARLVRRLAQDCETRSGVALRQASFEIEEFSALLDSGFVAFARAAWVRIAQGTVPDLPDADFVESMFASTLLVHMEAPQQLEFLRDRDLEAGQRVAMAALLKQLLPEQQRLLRGWSDDPNTLRIALWLLTVQKQLDIETATSLIAEALGTGDSLNRGLALGLAVRLDGEEGRRLRQMHRYTRELQTAPIERFYRTLAAVRDESPDEQGLIYIAPEFLGQALLAAPDEKALRWAPAFGQLLMTAAARFSDGPSTAVPMAIDSSRSDTPWRRVSSARPRSSGTTMFSRLSTWGGLPLGGPGAFLGDESASDERDDAIGTALENAAATGDWLFAAYIPPEAIGLLATTAPDTAAQLNALFRDASAGGRFSVSNLNP